MTRLLAALLLAAPLALQAQERVLDFHSEVRIDRRGGLHVVETIAVQVEGRQIRRGIFRDFPTEYRDRAGNRVSVPLAVQRVTRDGRDEPYRLEPLSNGTRIRIGRADVLLPRGRHVYEIAYRTDYQVGFFEDHDELYWNVNGNGWTLAFDRVAASVQLPGEAPAGRLMAEAYTGEFGARGRDYEVEVRDGGASFRTTRPLPPRHGLTIVVAFPKGVVAEPTLRDKVARFGADNPGAVIGVAGYAVLFALLFAAWWLLGRDPRPGPLFPRYEAPAGLGPAGVRFVDRMGYDDGCLAAALVGMGARGQLKIHEHEREFELTRLGVPAERLPGERALDGLFAGGAQRVRIGRTYDQAVSAVRSRFRTELEAKFGRRRLFAQNAGLVVLGVPLGVGVGSFMFARGASGVALAAFAIATVATLGVFFTLLPARSAAGRKVQDEIDGLRLYLGVAEKDDLARMQAPPATREEYARLLPYAIALGVEKTWAERFARTLGVAAVAAATAEFYSSDSGWGLAPQALSGAVSSLGYTISSAATPPGSSSGSSGGGSSGGGGGSSGGGGGGGGGGGW